MFPVDEKIAAIRAALAGGRDVVLSAPPGSGKTTRVPAALMDDDWLGGRKILMLEPRRLAARNCAEFIARSRGETCGESVGYRVRLERRTGPRTRLEILTEGLLARRLVADPELSGVGLIVFDEFHERSLACDLAFAMALDCQRALRPDLRLLVMSATLDTAEVAAHLAGGRTDGVATIEAAGRMFPVETRYLGELPASVAVARALRETSAGDVLCFLPGEGEIRRTAATLEERLGAAGVAADVLPLYGALPRGEQDRVFAPSVRRKVILATSVAETSLTIPGVTAVVDCGLMRLQRFSPATGMSALVTLPLSRDRAEQRRGRAGRTAPGVCYRLWTAADEARMPPRMRPEMLDADLCGLVLACVAWGAFARDGLPWLTMPPDAAWRQAAELLRRLGALDRDGRLTPHGEAMAQLGVHPRLANMLLGGGEGIYAAIVEEGVRSRETDIRRIAGDPPPRAARLAARLDALRRRPPAALSPGAQLAMAYPDRIAANRGNGTFRMVAGGGFFLEPGDPLARSPFLVACSLDERPGDAKLFLGCPVDKREIEELFGGDVRAETVCVWDRAAERVRRTVRRMLGEMTLEERPADGGEIDSEAIAAALLEGVRQRGVDALPCRTAAADRLRERMAFARRVDAAAWPDAGDEAMMAALPPFVGGMTKWRDLERLDLCAVLETLLAAAGRTRCELDRFAPERMEVPSGSRFTIDYAGAEPTCEARLQECFGMMDTPRVADGRIPVVMTLLSPARRPVQVTKDLAGFWRGAYALVRKDMRGRYPRHYWPEDPLTAVATRRVRPPGA